MLIALLIVLICNWVYNIVEMFTAPHSNYTIASIALILICMHFSIIVGIIVLIVSILLLILALKTI